MRKKPIYVAWILFGIITITSCETKKTENVAASAISSDQTFTIAMIDTDTIFAKYDMVVDMLHELEDVDKKLSDDFQRNANNFQKDYENYLKIGSTLTFSEQKKKEEQLQKRQQELQQMEQRYAQQLMETRTQRNQEVQNKIFEFVETYNKTHGNYTIIMSKSRTSGVLYSLPTMDITEEVLDALNEDYSQTRNKK